MAHLHEPDRRAMHQRMTHDYPALIAKLMERKGLDQAGIAAELGVTQSTISRWLKGARMSAEMGDKIVEMVRRSHGQGPATLYHKIILKVLGRVGAGAEIMPEFEQVPPEGLFEVEVDFPVHERAVAFEVEGDSMYPRFSAGDVIVCWEQAAAGKDAVGWEAVVRTADGRRFVKVIYAGSAPDRFNLHSHNAPLMHDQQLEWICRISLIVPRAAWHRRGR